MLISQKVAQRRRFLHSLPEIPRETLDRVADKIIRSTKFLVGKHLMANGEYIRNVRIRVYGSECPTFEMLEKKEKLWATYSRPCFPLMLIENDECAILIEQLSDGWRSQRIELNGFVAPFSMALKYELKNMPGWEQAYPTYFRPPQVRGREVWNLNDVAVHDRLEEALGMINPDQRKEAPRNKIEEMIQNIDCAALAAAETLLYINVANTRVHSYRPTSKELKIVPKEEQVHYIYRVLDLFRTRERYHSLGEVLSDVNRKEKSFLVEKRAHLVRGHFKEIGKEHKVLYWWNPFVRCRKNSKLTGIVEKDYRVHGT